MLGIPYDGSPEEVGAVVAILRGESIETICAAYRFTPEQIVQVFDDYMEYRREYMSRSGDRNKQWQATLAAMDSIIQVHFREAASGGNLKAAQVVFDMMLKRHRLEFDFWEEGRKQDADAPQPSDDQKHADTPQERARLREDEYARIAGAVPSAFRDASRMIFEHARKGD